MKEGKKVGKKEGRKEGRKIGRKEGRKEGKQECGVKEREKNTLYDEENYKERKQL